LADNFYGALRDDDRSRGAARRGRDDGAGIVRGRESSRWQGRELWQVTELR
jgi:hypothetical protein